MIEIASTRQAADAYKTAHEERGAAFATMVRGLFSRLHFPLGRPVLTGSSRWA